jgi:hypothetical protein
MKNTGKKDGVLKSEDLSFLNQIVVSIEQAEIKLEQAYRKKRVDQFNAIKQFIIKLNKKVLEVVE